MVAADNSELVSGLLLTSYPLHPPAKPERMRTEHFPKLKVPAFFVQGTRDPFGSIEQIEGARKLIAVKTRVFVVEGVGHDLGFGKKISPAARTLPTDVAEQFQNFLR